VFKVEKICAVSVESSFINTVACRYEAYFFKYGFQGYFIPVTIKLGKRYSLDFLESILTFI